MYLNDFVEIFDSITNLYREKSTCFCNGNVMKMRLDKFP